MPKKIRVCCGNNCAPKGSERIMQVIAEHFKLKPGEKNETIDLDFCGCTDFCDFGPNVVEDDEYIYHHARTRDIAERIEKDDKKKIEHATLDNLNLDEDLLL